MRYSPQFMQKLKEDARKAPVARFKTAASMMAYLNKPIKKKTATARKRS